MGVEVENQKLDSAGKEHPSGERAVSLVSQGQGLVTVEALLASEYPMSLDPDFDGHCPCSRVEGAGFKVATHCWRTCDGCTCRWSGVHVSGLDASTATKVAIHMRDNNGWTDHTDWQIVINGAARYEPEREHTER